MVSTLIYVSLGSQLLMIIRNFMYTNAYYYTNILAIIQAFGYWMILTYGLEHNSKADIFHLKCDGSRYAPIRLQAPRSNWIVINISWSIWRTAKDLVLWEPSWILFGSWIFLHCEADVLWHHLEKHWPRENFWLQGRSSTEIREKCFLINYSLDQSILTELQKWNEK